MGKQYLYSVYIKNYRAQASSMEIEQKETLLFTIPGKMDDGFPIIDPVIKTDMGKSGSMEFSVEPTMKTYDYFLQLKTIIRVTYGDRPLFRGRVLTIDTDNITGNRKIHCEGDLSFLLDTQIEGKEKNKQTKETVLSYIQALLKNHNEQVFDNDKTIWPGELPQQYSDWVSTAQRVDKIKDDKFRPTTWTSTSSALSSLTSKYGGFFTTRYVDGWTYLDWFKSCYSDRKNQQPIKLAYNVISASQTAEVNNLFTIVVPVGHKNNSSGKSFYLDPKYIPVDTVGRHYSRKDLDVDFHSYDDYISAIRDYGYIYKVVDFYDDANTEEKLRNRCLEWIRQNYYGAVDTFDVTALDEYVLDISKDPYFTGDIVELQFVIPGSKLEPITKRMRVIKSATYHLFDPEKNAYKIGIPEDLLAQRTDQSSSDSSSSSSSTSKSKTDDDGENENWWEKAFENFKDDKYNAFTKVWSFLTDQKTDDLPDIGGMEYLKDKFDGVIADKLGLKLNLKSGILSMFGNAGGADSEDSEGENGTEGTKSTKSLRSINTLPTASLKAVPEGSSVIPTAQRSRAFTIDMNGDISSEQIDLIKERLGLSEENIINLFGDLSDATKELAAQGVTITNIGSDVTLIHADLNDIERDLAAQGVSITKIGSDVTLIHSDLTQIEADLALQGVSITKIDTDVNLINANLTQIEADLATQGVTITKIGSDVILLHSDLTDLEASVAAQGVSITKIDSDLTLIGGTINDVEAELLEQGEQIVKINGDVVTINSSLTDMEAKLVEQGKTITKIDSDIVVIGGDLTDAQQQIIEDGKSLLALNQDVVDITGTLQAHEAKIGTLETDYLKTSELKAEIGAIDYINVQALGVLSNLFVNVDGTGTVLGSVNVADTAIASANITQDGNTYTLHLYNMRGNE